MSGVVVRKVENRKQMNDFIHVPRAIYQHHPQYVPDLESDIPKLFDVQSNPGLEFSDIQPFVAYRQDIPVGRVVGIVNRKANKRWEHKNVRFSMIEFIDDLEVSRALLQTVEEWGRERGMDTIQGPLGITDFDKEGMLVEGFDQMGSIITIYNPPYYPQHLEALGYKKEVDWVQMRLAIPTEVPEKYARVARMSKELFGLSIRKLTTSDITKGGYGRKVFHLFNEAYYPIFGFVALTDEQIDSYVAHYLKLIDKQLIPIIENDKGELVGAAVSMVRLSDACRKSGGRLFPFGWLHFLRSLKLKHEDTAELLLIGIRPDYQGLGVNALFFDHLIPLYNRYGFKWAETGPQLEDNVRELSQWKPLKPELVKRRRCYKKIL